MNLLIEDVEAQLNGRSFPAAQMLALGGIMQMGGTGGGNPFKSRAYVGDVPFTGKIPKPLPPVLAGHGTWDGKWTTVPKGTTVTTYSRRGGELSDGLVLQRDFVILRRCLPKNLRWLTEILRQTAPQNDSSA